MTAKQRWTERFTPQNGVNVVESENEVYQRIRLLNAIPTRTIRPLNDL